MKGKAKIELIDAKSGEVVQTVESDNLVTNAINNVYNLPTVALWSGGSELTDYWKYMFGSSLADKMLCGMLCFSEDVLADVNHCIPSNEEMDNIVAYAGKRGNVDSSNLMRGNFDSANSVIGSNYASLVFNWGTSEGNGIVKSVCLTSMMGGEQAYHASQMELKKTLCSFKRGSYEAMGSLLSVQEIPNQEAILGMTICGIDSALAVYGSTYYVTKSGKLVLIDHTDWKNVKVGVWKVLPEGQRLGISTNLDMMLTDSNCEQEKLFDVYSLLFRGAVHECASEYSRVFLSFLYEGVNTTIRGVELSGDDVELSSFVVVVSNPNFSWTISSSAKVGDFLYFGVNSDWQGVYRVSILTGEVDEIPLPGKGSPMGVFLGQVCVGVNNPAEGTIAERYRTYRISNVDLSTHLLSINTKAIKADHTITVSKIDTLPEPFVVVNNGETVPRLAFVTAYLGTVNNLSTPVTKTSAQAMRITYTLTDS